MSAKTLVTIVRHRSVLAGVLDTIEVGPNSASKW
jgi:hypothetical protein